MSRLGKLRAGCIHQDNLISANAAARPRMVGGPSRSTAAPSARNRGGNAAPPSSKWAVQLVGRRTEKERMRHAAASAQHAMASDRRGRACACAGAGSVVV